MHSVGVWWMWIGFFIFILSVLTIDMFVLDGKSSRRVSIREACAWTAIWVSCAFLFGGFLWVYLSATTTPEIANAKTVQFFTGFLIEKSLSVDNLFVFLMIFSYFAVPPEHQRRILMYGIWGALILRFLMIAFGTWLVTELHWVLYIFGAILLMTGVKMFFFSEEEKDLGQDPLVRWLNRHLRMTKNLHGNRFFVREQGVLLATPLFLVLVMVEITDVIFALDSIPAIFAITLDPFIVFTSNMFAILGLRALYFLLARIADRFYLLKYGIAIMLAFIGIKMLIAPWYEMPTSLALLVLLVVLSVTAILSCVVPKRTKLNKEK